MKKFDMLPIKTQTMMIKVNYNTVLKYQSFILLFTVSNLETR